VIIPFSEGDLNSRRLRRRILEKFGEAEQNNKLITSFSLNYLCIISFTFRHQQQLQEALSQNIPTADL